jgi:hypothetical protein
VPGWLTVFGARMPLAYTTWMEKVYKLNQKLKLSSETMALVGACTESITACQAQTPRHPALGSPLRT